MNKILTAFSFVLFLTAQVHAESPYVIVLGVAQDGGYPHAGCNKCCCCGAWNKPEKKRYIACLGIIDPESNETWMLDATPDFREQLKLLHDTLPSKAKSPQMHVDGIFLTHGHIGHYTGLMFLGRESMCTSAVPVYCMPKMADFLSSNGPWNQLVSLNNIAIHIMQEDEPIQLNERISITPILVPHRGEYTETVGFIIKGPEHSAVFIPDIDKWTVWERSIADLVAQHDRAYLDGSFYADGEILRPMSEVPHPFIEESIREFNHLTNSDKSKVHFIHLNHTNPVIDPNSIERANLLKLGYQVADELEKFSL